MSETNIKSIYKNRKAYFNYEILETLEAGVCLLGTEIKSLRSKGCNITESYVRILNNEAWIMQMEIPIYPFGNIQNHEPFRKRKLLLHKKQIIHVTSEIERKNLSAIPLQVYLKNGRAKILIGVGRGKRKTDKRETIKKRISEKEMKRIVKNVNLR